MVSAILDCQARTGPESVLNSSSLAAVVCREVTREFGDGAGKIRALQGISLTIPAGEMTLLVGPSGCGKTTLISIIAGLLEPTTGQVEVLGTRLHQLSGGKLVDFRARNIGFVFQQYNLLPALTAVENVAVPLIIGGQSRRRAVARALALLGDVGLGDRAGSFPNQLSGGQQQRVAIARALIHEPRLLVCDEPTAALDGRSGQVIMDLLRRVAVQPGRAVVTVTHDNRVFGFGDRIVSLSDGRIEGIEILDRARGPAIP